MGQKIKITVAGSIIPEDKVFHLSGKNYISFRELVKALEGTDEGTVFWNPPEAKFIVKDRVSGKLQTITVNTNGLNDIAPAKRNGIDVVFHKSMNMIAIRDMAKLAGIEKYLDWYNEGTDQHVNLVDPSMFTTPVKATLADAGGISKNMPQNIFQVIYACPPELNRNTMAGKIPNMYGGYNFTVTDALNWLIQTGGNINIVMQTRITEDATKAANGQYRILRAFIDAHSILADMGYKINMPGFYVGSTEKNPGSAKAIYNLVEARLSGNGKPDNMLAGIYYGKEDPPNISGKLAPTTADIQTADFIHGKGKKLLWIPYIHQRYDDSLNNLLTFATNSKGTDGRQMFDIVIVQPGSFYFKEKAGNIEKILAAILAIEKTQQGNTANNTRKNVTLCGIEFEYDMGLITGRKDAGTPMNPNEKKDAFKEYLKRITPYIGSMPIGIYSGGPNEQGYNNLSKNANFHNNGNHVPFFEGMGNNDLLYNGLAYSGFWTYTKAKQYVGNLIYDINDYLFRGIMRANLRTFLN